MKPIYKQMFIGKKYQSFKKCKLTASILSNSVICSCAIFKHAFWMLRRSVLRDVLPLLVPPGLKVTTLDCICLQLILYSFVAQISLVFL